MLGEVKIRRYVGTDYDSCHKLWIELTKYHQEIYEDDTIGGENLGQGFIDHVNEFGDENIWVAEVDKVVVGLIGLIIKGKTAEVEPIIVNSSYREKGIGSRLLQFIIEYASDMELKFLSIRPVARNKTAFNMFYEKGFNIVGHVELFMDLKDKENEKWKKGIKIHDIPLRY